jgi:PAS domain S-box-containing protein
MGTGRDGLRVLIVAGERDAARLVERLSEGGCNVRTSLETSDLRDFEPDVVIFSEGSHVDRADFVRVARRARIPIALLPTPSNSALTDKLGTEFVDLVHPDSPALLSRLDNLGRLRQFERQRMDRMRRTVDYREDLAPWRALVDGAPNVIMRLDASGIVEYANRPITGEEDPRGRRFTDVFGGDPGPRLAEAFEEVISSGSSYQEQLVVDTDGRERVYLAHFGPVFDGSGSITGASLIVSDITAQHRSTQMSRRYIRRLNVLQEHLPLLMYEGMTRENGGMHLDDFQIHGSLDRASFRREDPTYDDWMACIHPDDWERYHDALRAVGSGELSTWTVEYRWRTESGDWIWMLDRGVRIDTNERRVVGFALDVTDRKDLETQLAHAQKMEAVGRLAGGVAHDFNNLLTSIINFTWYVRDELPEESPLRVELGEVLTAAESGAQLTGRLLAFSRRRPVQPESVELNDRLTTIHRVLRRTLGENIEVIVSQTDDPLEVMIDPGQFDQLLFNLAVNARDAMPDGGVLRIELTRAEQDAVLSITDTGIGIAENEIDHVFDPFYTTKGEEGTGLGLATCYGIVSQADGSIEVHPEPEGGTTFTVRLPLADARSLPATREYTPIPSVDDGTVALVVEDQPAILQTVTRTLERVGYAVQGATTSEEAMVLLDEADVEPQIMVTDVVLPGLSGPKLADKLRERLPELRVVLMSGYLGDEYESVAQKTPNTVFLAKPFTPAELLARVAVLTGPESA